MPLQIQFSGAINPRDANFSDYDRGRIIVEYLNAAKTSVLYTYDTDWVINENPYTTWHVKTDNHVPPVGTRYVRISVYGKKEVGTDLSVYFDAISLKVNSAITGLSSELVTNGGFEGSVLGTGSAPTPYYNTGWPYQRRGGTWPMTVGNTWDEDLGWQNEPNIGGSAYEGTKVAKRQANLDATYGMFSNKDAEIDVSAWADEIDGIVDVPEDITERKFTIYPDKFNLVLNPDIVIDSITSDSGGNLAYASLLNPLPTRKVEFTSNSLVEIVYDITGIEAAVKHITDVIIYNHNIALNGLITVQASAFNNDWNNAPFEITQTIPEDRDTDPDALTDLDYPSGLKNVLAATKSIHVRLGYDLYAYSYIRILIEVDTPSNPDNISFSGLFVGTKLQTTINHNLGWIQGFVDKTPSEDFTTGRYFGIGQSISQEFKFTFEFQNTDDARLARFVIYDSGATYCYISVDYNNTNDWDEIRKHALTMYGLIDIDNIKEKRAYEMHSFTVNFIEARV